jgi:hypothetical protein
MLTFYYLNEEEIERQYSQIVPFVMTSYEKWVSNARTSEVKLSLGSFFKFLGLNLGGIETSIERDKASGEKFIHTLTLNFATCG